MDKSQAQDPLREADNGATAHTLRIGVYVCHCGGNISDVVDVERVVLAGTGLSNGVVTRH